MQVRLGVLANVSVLGGLVTQGSAGSPVVFTSDLDTGPPPAGNQYWGAMTVSGSSTRPVELNGVEMRYGGNNGGGACISNKTLEVSANRQVSIRSSIIKNSGGYALTTAGNQTDPLKLQVTGSSFPAGGCQIFMFGAGTFEQNLFGVAFQTSGGPANPVVLRANKFLAAVTLGAPGPSGHVVKFNDILAGLSIASSPTPDITRNWWGRDVNAMPRPFCPLNYPAPPVLPPWGIVLQFCPGTLEFLGDWGVATPIPALPSSGYDPAVLAGAGFSAAAMTFGGGPLSTGAQVCTPDVQAPVECSTGNFWHTFGGLSIPGRGVPLDFNFTYNAGAAASNGPLGFGWTHSYNIRLSGVGTSTVTVHEENGAQIPFTQSGANWVAPTWADATLTPAGSIWTFTRFGRLQFTFNTSGAPAGTARLASLRNLTDPATAGYLTTVTYPSATQMVVTSGFGRTLTFTLNAAGRISAVADNSTPARSVGFTYNAAQELIAFNDPVQMAKAIADRRPWKFDYQAGGTHRMTGMVKPNESALTTPPKLVNTYDSAGRVTAQTDWLGRTTSFSYGVKAGTGQPMTVVTDPRGNKTLKVFNGGVLVAKTVGFETAAASTWLYELDPNELGATRMIDPNGNTTTHTYDTRGNVLTAVDGEGRTSTFTYDSFNNPLTVTAPNPSSFGPATITTTNTYDTGGRLLTTSSPLYDAANPTTPVMVQTTYTRADTARPDDVTSITDPDGKVSTFTYDPTTGYQLTATDPLGNKNTRCYNNRGNVTETVAPKGGTFTCGAANSFKTTITYNQNGQPLVVTPPTPASRTTRTYDDDGNVKTVKVQVDTNTANDLTTTYNYDAADQLISTTRPDSSVLASEFWPDGQLKLQKDGSNTTTFTYNHDSQGRLTSVVDALNQTTSYTYDPAGRVTGKTDPANSCGVGVSCVTSYSYNKANQPLTVTYSDGVTPNVAYTYRANGQQATMVDGTGTTTYNYDSLGRVTSHIDGAGTTIGYGYNLRSLQTSIVYPGAKTVTRAYDNAGRIDTIIDWSGRVFDYTLDANSNVTTLAFPAGSTNSDVMAYNNADQLTSTLMKQGATNLVSLTYTIDKSNRLTQETRAGTPGVPGGSRRYAYSKLDQLCFDAASTATGGSCATPPAGGQPYTYSPADNLTRLPQAVSQQYNAANQLCWTSPTASANACGTPPAGATSYTYDTRGNRTTKTPSAGSAVTYAYDQANRLKTVTTGATLTATNTYNGAGLRTAKTVGATTTNYTWDHSAGLPLMLIEGANYWVYGPDGLPLERVDSNGTGTVLYHHHDRLGSTRLVTTTTGTTAATATYDPYGTPTTTGTPTSLGYTGQHLDTETGLYYLRARHYDPATGQFIQRDPIAGFTGEEYGYAGNEPTNNVDPSGTIWCPGKVPWLCTFTPSDIEKALGWLGSAESDSCPAPPRVAIIGGYYQTRVRPAAEKLQASGLTVITINDWITASGATGDIVTLSKQYAGWARANELKVVDIGYLHREVPMFESALDYYKAYFAEREALRGYDGRVELDVLGDKPRWKIPKHRKKPDRRRRRRDEKRFTPHRCCQSAKAELKGLDVDARPI